MSLQRASRKFIDLSITVLLLFIIQGVSAQNQGDTAKFTLLASLEKKAELHYITKECNVVFPEILKGNEEEMLPYIEKFSTEKRDYLNRMYKKGRGFLPKAAIILKKYNLPEELNVLLVLESEYNGNVVSRAGAVGYWQIMDETARAYGMKYNSRFNKIEKEKLLNLNSKSEEGGIKAVAGLKDDRQNFYRATHAAARYLRDSKHYVNEDWLMVVASYNCGVGRVRKAIRKSGKTDPTFWDVRNYLPAVTRAYVMNFITLSVIFNNYVLFANNALSFNSEKIMVPADLERNRIEVPAQYSDR